MGVTIRDIAKLAGVSPSTVSKVLNGKGSVSPEVREKIEKIAEESNYRPNLNAQALRTQSTNTIGVIMPDVTNLYYCYLMKGIEAQCQEENFSVLVGTCNYNAEREREYYDLFQSKNVSGIIIVTIGNIDRFPDHHRMVTTNQQLPDEESCDCVTIDNFAAGYELTQYLINLGHQKIVYVNSGSVDAVSQKRLEGFTTCMKDHGLEITKKQIFDGSLFLSGSYEAGQKIILSSDLPTAVICHNNTNAYGVSKALQDAGYRIPDDISIACFDAINQGDLYGSQFTCIMQPVERIGREAAGLLIQKSKGQLPETQTFTKLLPYELVFGNSVRKI